MKFLVPTDFSSTSKKALHYAIDLAKQMHGGAIVAVHVVDSEDLIPASELEFKRFVQGLETPDGFSTETIVIVGNLYDAIGQYAKSHGFDLIIMSTEGATGLQKVLGSHAVRMIQHSKVPFIVVQKEIVDAPGGVKEIALPVTLEKEDKAILAAVTDLALVLKAKIEIIYQEKSDEFLAATMKRNLNFTNAHFKNRGVETHINVVDEGADFSKEIIRIALAQECDLIATINKHDNGIANLFGWNFDQNMLENNAHIPVLTIDALPAETAKDIFGVNR